MDLNLDTFLRQAQQCVAQYGEDAGKDRAIIAGYNNRGVATIGSSDKSDKLARHFFVKSEETERSMRQNDATRTAFYKALLDHFTTRRIALAQDGINLVVSKSEPHIPQSVLDVLNLDKFGLDAQNTAHSGRPLTARRVLAVMDAVKRLDAKFEHLAARLASEKADRILLHEDVSSLAPGSDARCLFLNGIRREIMNEFDFFYKATDERAAGRLHYRGKVVEKLDKLMRSLLHDVTVPVNDWSRTAIRDSVRHVLSRVEYPDALLAPRPGVRLNPPFSQPLPDREVHLDMFRKALETSHGLVGDFHVNEVATFGDLFDKSAMKFFTAQLPRVRDYLANHPATEKFTSTQMAACITGAMKRFSLFVGDNVLPQSWPIDPYDNEHVLLHLFNRRGDFALGFFLDALDMELADPGNTQRRPISGPTVKLFTDAVMSTVDKDDKVPVAELFVRALKNGAGKRVLFNAPAFVPQQIPPAPQPVVRQIVVPQPPVVEEPVQEPPKAPPKALASIYDEMLAGEAKSAVDNTIDHLFEGVPGITDVIKNGIKEMVHQVVNKEVDAVKRNLHDPIDEKTAAAVKDHAWKISCAVETALQNMIMKGCTFEEGKALKDNWATLLMNDSPNGLKTQLSALHFDVKNSPLEHLRYEIGADYKEFVETCAAGTKDWKLPQGADKDQALGAVCDTLGGLLNSEIFFVKAELEELPKTLAQPLHDKKHAAMKGHLERALAGMKDFLAGPNAPKRADGSFATRLQIEAARIWRETKEA